VYGWTTTFVEVLVIVLSLPIVSIVLEKQLPQRSQERDLSVLKIARFITWAVLGCTVTASANALPLWSLAVLTQLIQDAIPESHPKLKYRHRLQLQQRLFLGVLFYAALQRT